MGLDIYVGSFTRYYAGRWETAAQKHAREQGLALEVLSADRPSDVVTDPEQIRPAVLAWRDQLSQGFGANIDGLLDWDETDSAPYFTDKPAWDCYSSLLLWAAYSEHPEMRRPRDAVEDWTKDAALRRSADPDSGTAFPHLMRNVEIWLPHDLPFVFRAPDPAGHALHFGSSLALAEELAELNRRTWNADDAVLAQWRRDGSEHEAPLETGARFAFAIMTELARQAIAHRLIMKLDY